jgi:glycine dehydrogenase subunit 1
MGERSFSYPYIPNSVPEIKREMMREVGVNDIMALYEEIPEHLRFKGKLNMPDAILDEYSIKRHVSDILNKNANCEDNLNFLGAGCAQHFVPAVCDEINGRGEFLTAYVGEAYADHGKWQAFFEYSSLMAELLDMDILSVPLYDGAQAVATSLRMAVRATGRNQVLVPATMNPETAAIARNYVDGPGGPQVELVEVGYDPKTGLLDLADLKAKISDGTAAVCIENPTFLGLIESQAEEIGQIARSAGAEFVVACDPISLGVLAPPAQYGATLACGDLHPLGIHLHGGGGQGGFVATHDEMRLINEFKDLMFGLTETVKQGEYGFGEVLFDRTSYGSRDEGKEFTGTSTGLWAITAGVYLALMGPNGMEEVGETIMQRAQYAAKQLSALDGISLAFGGPFFKEFVVNFDGTGKSVAEINAALLEHGIFGGKDLSADFPAHGQSALYCVTEIMTKADIDKLVGALAAVSA